MRSRLKLAFVFVASSLFAASPAHAIDWSVNANVVTLEATYMPGYIVVAISGNAGANPACAAGRLLTYTPSGADATARAQNANAVFSLLLSAKLANKAVTFTGVDVNCTIQYVTMT